VKSGRLPQELFEPLGIEEENIEVLDVQNYQDYDRQIAEDGGLDLVLMGIGGDGHHFFSWFMGT
jgi:6-phosphogluconolactonase/glucosamine-6-phosphate isomerase/deaminase